MTNSSTTFAKPSLAPAPSEKSATARALLKVITGYQRLTGARVSACRFYPSCSAYAAEAIETHGAARGSLFAIRRLSRCRPLGPHGVDLVPLPKEVRSTQR
jgi:putative membrane protein insertion efficiency factor